MQPDLPETYYLDNVLTLFGHVERLYADILDLEQLTFLETFSGLGEDAKKLCIRLLNRSGDWFRAGKLRYSEIASIDSAIDELAITGLLRVDDEIDAPTLLSLFTRAELIAVASDGSGLEKLRRGELEAILLERSDGELYHALKSSDRLLEVPCRDQYQICQMLFFGNLNQSMTDFVLRDLGLYQFESYTIDHDHRPYRDSLEIRQHWMLYQLEAIFELCDSSTREPLDEIAALIPGTIEPQAPAYRKSERLRYRIARQYERIGELDPALALYRQCRLPPGRERIARIHDRQGNHRAAIDLCLEIIETALDDEELQFACAFASRLAKRHGIDMPQAVERRRNTHRPDTIDLELDYHDPVEIAVAKHYNALDAGDTCFYVENSLFSGVLGLLIWDTVFAPQAGAFFNPFQSRPTDFHAIDFCSKRRERLTETWASINSNNDILDIVSARWWQKHGLMNPLVNWQNLDPGIIEIALERIDFAHWRAVFDRILRDLRNNRAGFPDLVHFPPGGGYCLIEVKGPGDSLQKNQQRWMQYFHQKGIPHQLARVTWRND